MVWSLKKRDTLPAFDQATAENLLHKVYGFAPTRQVSTTAEHAAFYHWARILKDHLNNLQDLNPSLIASLTDADHICELLVLLREKHDVKIREIYNGISANGVPAWIDDDSDDNLDSLLRFAIELWLFLEIDLSDHDKSIKELVEVTLAGIKGDKVESLLPTDFSKAMLRKRGKFRFDYTNDLTEHLSMKDEQTIRIFGHASIMDHYRDIHAKER